MPKTRIVRWSDGLAIRIPKGVAKRAGLKAGDVVVIEASAGRIELRQTDKALTLERLVGQITPENRHHELDWGPAAGRERID
jgi:antitoxin MazE